MGICYAQAIMEVYLGLARLHYAEEYVGSCFVLTLFVQDHAQLELRWQMGFVAVHSLGELARCLLELSQRPQQHAIVEPSVSPVALAVYPLGMTLQLGL